jgi:hypothetical protein
MKHTNPTTFRAITGGKGSSKKFNSSLPWETVAHPEDNAFWIECYIAPLDWTYSVEPTENMPPTYQAFLINPNDSITFLGKPYKTEAGAIKACERHLLNTSKNLCKLLKIKK